MNHQKFLGEFEQIVLLAVMQLGDDAYGSSIRQLLHEQIHRDVSVGALYTTLERLDGKGLLHSRMGEATAQRGGRAKKYFKVSSVGRSQLEKTRTALNVLWQGIGKHAHD